MPNDKQQQDDPAASAAKPEQAETEGAGQPIGGGVIPQSEVEKQDSDKTETDSDNG